MMLWLAPLALTVVFQVPTQAPGSDDVRGLPVIERPGGASGPGADVVVIVLTGDGGWAPLVKGVAAELRQRGAAIAGLDMRAYLSSKRTPDEVSRDVGRMIRHYMVKWRRDHVVLVGYSRGADLLPFALTRLPQALRDRVTLLALLGPGEFAGFEFRWQDLLRDVKREGALPVGPELLRLRGVPMLCVYGDEETSSACAAAPAGLMRLERREGGHHFDRDYGALGQLIWGLVVRDS